MPHSETTFKTSDGTELFAQSWSPDGETRAHVVLVHGLAEHSARYAHVAGAMNEKGIALHSFDGRGHGRTGTGAFFESIDRYMQDVDEIVAGKISEAAGKPVFVYGHSMGGGITTLWAIENRPDVAGLILTGAALKRGDDVPAILEYIAPILAAIAPKMATLALDSTLISRDPAEVKKYDDDPLVYSKPSPARTGAELIKMIRRITPNQSKLTAPVLIMHGTGDKITNVEGSKDLYAQASSADKTLELFDGYYHEIHNEPERAEVLAKMIAWIEARI